jgi:hypothetical protein
MHDVCFNLDFASNFCAAGPNTSITSKANTVVISRADRITVREGGSMVIRCSSTGVPIPTISWTLNGQRADLNTFYQLTEPRLSIDDLGIVSTRLGEANSTIQIGNIQYPADEGVYVCTGSTIHAGIERINSASLTVTVLGMFLVDMESST